MLQENTVCLQGDLKQFLIATRKSSVGVVGNKERPMPLTVKQSLNIAKQVASALERLSSKNYTHRDVAARNCLITSALNVKVTFSSLCKTTYAAEYYFMRNQVIVPICVPIMYRPDDLCILMFYECSFVRSELQEK